MGYGFVNEQGEKLKNVAEKPDIRMETPIGSC